MASPWCHESFYDAHCGVMISRAKFYAHTFCGNGGVKSHSQRELCFIMYCIYMSTWPYAHKAILNCKENVAFFSKKIFLPICF